MQNHKRLNDMNIKLLSLQQRAKIILENQKIIKTISVPENNFILTFLLLKTILANIYLFLNAMFVQ